MGLYDTIQEKLGNAFDNALFDAVRTLQFVTIVDVYNPVTMISAQTEVEVPVRAVVTKDLKSEVIDSSSGFDTFDVLVLDSDRNGVVFKKDMQIKDESDYYKIKSFDSDPAKASWVIKARKLG